MGAIKHEATSGGGRRSYQRLVIGRPGVLALARYELGAWLAVIPGATGIGLRWLLLGPLLGTRLRRVAIGRSVTIRHPHRLRVGPGSVIDELCAIDAGGDDDPSVVIGARAMLARGCKVAAKGGSVVIGDGCGLGANTTVHAPVGSFVNIGDDTAIGPGVFIGGSNYRTDDPGLPISHQGYEEHQGVTIGRGVWLGAGVIVLDGVTIGDGAMIGAGAVVTRDIPALAIARGVPAKVVGSRMTLGIAGA